MELLSWQAYHCLLAYTMENDEVFIRVLSYPRVPQDNIETSLFSSFSHIAS
jgi:hypothetical protein